MTTNSPPLITTVEHANRTSTGITPKETNDNESHRLAYRNNLFEEQSRYNRANQPQLRGKKTYNLMGEKQEHPTLNPTLLQQRTTVTNHRNIARKHTTTPTQRKTNRIANRQIIPPLKKKWPSTLFGKYESYTR